MIRFVYVAGPLTKPSPAHNVKKAIDAADQLLALGFMPFVPHLSHLWDTVSPKDYEDWMRWDMAWLGRCDALLRLAGESSGADREVEQARTLGIPVFGDVFEIVAARPVANENIVSVDPAALRPDTICRCKCGVSMAYRDVDAHECAKVQTVSATSRPHVLAVNYLCIECRAMNCIEHSQIPTPKRGG